MQLNAKPNLNGNTPSDFRKAASELYDAARVVDAALRKVELSVTHGRNYQQAATTDEAWSLRDQDLAIINKLWGAQCDMDALAQHIVRATK